VHKVTVLTRRLPNTSREETIGKVKVVRISCGDSRYLFTFAAIPKVLRYAKDADVVHTTTFNAAPPAWLGARLRGKPVIISVHETWMGKWRQYTDFSLFKAWLHDLLERMVFFPRYDRYVCGSKSTAKQLAHAKPRLKERITLIYYGFEPEHWSKKRETASLRKKHKLQGKFVVLGYGRPGASKGFPYVVDAFPQIKKRIRSAVLVLILSNDSQYAKELQRMKRGAHKDIIFLPSQPYHELPRFLQMADCVVFPSLTEGFGYVALETAAAGTPIVASDTTSIPEVVCGKHVLVPPKDPAALAAGVERVFKKQYDSYKLKSFPWSRTIKEYEKEYARLR
jgi:D-inositol-3-phosphate glycosyltransferase